MSKVRLTVRQILDLGLWEKVCDYKGWDHYILNEGMISEDEVVEFDSKFKREDTPKELKLEMVVYLRLRKGESEEDAITRLDELSYDNDINYIILRREVQDIDE